MLNKKIKEYLDDLDENPKPLNTYMGEHVFSKDIKNILSEQKEYKLTKNDIAEQIAFDFMSAYQSEQSGWGTYHGPMFVLPNDKGQMVEYPSIKRIDNEIIEHWVKRMGESKNPILIARYADLVVDFSSYVGKKVDLETFKKVIDSNINICKKALVVDLDCKTKLKRSLHLAIMINDQDRINELKVAVIDLENRVTEDDKPGLWGFSFQWLILDFYNKIIFGQNEKEALIDKLEDKVKKFKDNPVLIEYATFPLAEYYARENDVTNLIRILGVFENTIKKDSRNNSDALIKMHAYERIHEIYIRYSNKFSAVKESRDRISKEISNLDLDWDKSLKTISTEIKIKQGDIDSLMEVIFGKDKEDDIEKVLAKIAVHFLPKKSSVEKELSNISAKYPMQFICTQQVISDDGVLIAKLSPLEEDYDNHFIKYACQYTQLLSIMLPSVINLLKKHFTAEQVFDYFSKATLFEDEDKKYLNKAIYSYWSDDYLISSHLFVPLIESAIRDLVKKSNGLILVPNSKTGGYDRVLLGGLLNNYEIFEKTFSKSGHNLLFYFRLVLTEKLGMNLRNDFAHGFGKKKFFNREVSDRLFHVLIWLSMVRNSG